jgi:predicted secreted protein
MALYSGVTGKISVKKGASGTETDIAHMANFSVEISKDIIEAISFGNDYKEKVPSIKDWTASFDGSTDFDSSSGQKDLVDAFESGDVLSCAFYLTEDIILKGDAYIESLSISDAADGKSEISISLSGSNAITLTVPAQS